MGQDNEYGKIGWIDLTVDDAGGVSAFYEAVTGWKREAVPVDNYEDYCVSPPGSDEPIAGICHARGPNAGMPAQWLMYITIPDLQSSLHQCESLGGSVICPARDMGSYGQMAVVADPAGAVIALMQPAED